MISMKMPKSNMKPSMGMKTMEQEKPMYPYGLCINLDKDTLTKLGIKEIPKVGESIEFHAKAFVSSIYANKTEHDDTMSVGLQITDMMLMKEKEMLSAEDVLYGAKK